MKLPLIYAAFLTLIIPTVSAQTSTQIKLSQPNSGDGSGYSVDTTGRHQNVYNLSRSTTRNDGAETAEATNTTTWDINPAAGSIQISSASSYEGWNGSGVTLDTRYAFANFDTFTVNAGNTGLANGAAVKINLAVEIDASAQTDAFKFQDGSNTLDFTIQQRDPVPGYLGNTYSDELLKVDFDVTVYEFVEKAVLNGVTQFDNTTTYVNGQGNEAESYSFDIEIDAVVGETIELGMLVGDFNPNVYDYDLTNLVEGTRQNIGNSQEDYSNEFAATFSWDIEHVAGFEGLDVVAASGFVTSASAVPEPATAAALAGMIALGAVVVRRRQRNSCLDNK